MLSIKEFIPVRMTEDKVVNVLQGMCRQKPTQARKYFKQKMTSIKKWYAVSAVSK
jgi:hypothetical protein